MSKKNGCTRPFSSEQIGAWVCQIIAISFFAVLISSGIIPDDQKSQVVICWVISVLLGCVFWSWCQFTNPAQVGRGLVPTCVNHEPHYCAVCKVSVPGLDHHCKWLGICIGTRTYGTFFALLIMGAFSFFLESLVLILSLSVWKNEEVVNSTFGSDTAYNVALGFCLILSLPLATFYGLLLGFHAYLQYYMMTTYEFFLQRAQNKRKAVKNNNNNNNNTRLGGQNNGIEMSGKPLGVVRTPSAQELTRERMNTDEAQGIITRV